MSNTITLQIGGALDLNLRVAPPEAKPILTVTYGRFIATAEETMAVTLPAGHQITVEVSYVDNKGNPASVDGEVAWTSSNSEIAEVTVDPADSMTATVQAIGGIGDAQITATADADLGEGTKELVTFLDMHVIPGEAVAGTINVVGTTEPIP
jgi:hypothetical protein